MTEVDRKQPLSNQDFRAWAIILTGAIFYCFQFILRVSPNVMGEEMMEAYMINGLAFGGLVGFYYWGYSAMQLPLGITMDRFGPRYLISAAGFICTASCLAFAFTDSLFVASCARFMIGAAGACGLIGTLKLGTLWLVPSKLGRVIALTMVFGTVGASLGGGPLSHLVQAIGWRETYEVFAVIGVAIGVLAFILIRNPSAEGSHEDEALPFLQNRHPFQDVKALAVNPQAWIIALYGMLMYVPITVIGDAWGTRFVGSAAGVPEQMAAPVSTAMFVGAAIGSPVFTTLSDYLAKRRLPMVLGAAAALTIYLAILLYDGGSVWVYYLLFGLAGFFYTSKVLTFAVICEIMPRNMSGVATASINMVVMIAGFFHPLVGALMDYSWSGTYENGIPAYSTGDYRFALTLLPICLFLSLIAVKFIKETHPESGSTFREKPSVDMDVL